MPLPQYDIKDPVFQAKLNVLSSLVMNNVEDLFEKLDVNVEVSGGKYIGTCCVHGGDNETALNLYYDGYSVPGFWVCRTKRCEKVFSKNIVGFTRGRLSRIHHDYSPADNPRGIYSFPKTINFLCDFAGTSIEGIKYDHKLAERQMFIAECQDGTKFYSQQISGVPREKVKKSLHIPAQYYIDRGYSPEVLSRYDVGIPKKAKQENVGRVIVPIYNEGNFMVGYSARSIHERCGKCKHFHSKDEDCSEDREINKLRSKWRHIDFESSQHLYNYHEAKPHIIKSNVAILVEGPGDVWKLEEAGIHNSVAIFGVNLSSAQQRLLAKASTMTIISLLDNDPAGIEGAKRLKQEYGRLFRMYFPKIKAHDVGDTSIDVITNEIKPLLRSLEVI